MNIQSLVRENIKQLKPYATARDEFKGPAEVYLDANENPFSSLYNRYPDPLQKKLKEKIATLKGVSADQLFLGNGSDEAIDLLIRVFCEPGKDSILLTEPTYGMYSVCAAINNITVKKVLLTEDFDLDVESVKAQWKDTVKLVFLCSPNNPSGNLLSKNKVTEIIKGLNTIVVVDEAYIDFTDDPGFVPMLDQHPNLIVLQTLSKAWGLAGLRLGMAFASPEIINLLNKIKYPYNINSITQSLVLDKLNDVEIKNEQVKLILAQRSILTDQLSQLNFIKKVYRSDANFILAKMEAAQDVYHYLIRHNIIVRDRSSVLLCEGCLRITIGTPEENQKLMLSLKNYTQLSKK
jgi:histidinol-phosphate aminotransferase